MLKHLPKFISMLATLAIVWNTTSYSQTRDLGGTGKLLDGIAAIVNDGVVLRSELNEQLEAVIANLENQELDFIVLNEGLLIAPEKKSRIGWQIDKEKIKPKVTWEW